MMTRKEGVNGQLTLSAPDRLWAEGRCAAESRSDSKVTRGRSPSPQGAQAGARRLAFAFAFVAGLVLGAGAVPVVGELAVKSVGDSYAEIEVPITAFGDDATQATVAFSFNDGAATQTYAPATNITEEGTATLTLRKLLPGYTYSVTATVTNDKDESATTATAVSLTTMKTADAPGLPGLYQTYFKSAHKAWTKDYTTLPEGTDWKNYSDSNRIYRRELGAIMAYNNKGNGDSPCPHYVSELWSDEIYWPESGGQWAYWGYMYFDASKSYKLRCYMMDTFRIVVTHPTTGEQAFCFYGDDYKNPFTSSTFAPPVTGWYPIELRFSNGSGRAGGSQYDTTNGGKYTVNLGWSADDGSTWNFLIDSGDASLLRTGIGSFMTATESVADGSLRLDLSFAEADTNRTLVAVWGPQHGGETTNGWAHAEVVGTVAAGATTATYAMPSTWGTDDNLVVRFCLVVSEGVPCEWSNSTYWRDLTAPVLADVAADGSGGDTLEVKGTVKSFAGSSCAVKVLVGTSQDALAEWSGAATTLAAAGDFAFTLRADEANARDIAPGTTYYVQVEATADGKTSRSETTEVKTLGAAEWASATASATRNVVTFKGRLNDVGMKGKAQVTLWVGKDKDSLAQVGEAITVSDIEFFTIAHTFEKGGVYSWQFRAANASAGGTANLVAASDLQSVATKDVTAYTWKKDVATGAWEDEANWEADPAVGSYGYPQTSDASVTFAEGTKAAISLSTTMSLSKIVAASPNLDVAIRKGGSAMPTLTVANAFAFSGSGSVLAFDGVSVKNNSGTASSIGAGFTLAVDDGATFDIDPSRTTHMIPNAGGTLRLGNGATAKICDYVMSNGATTILSNATLTIWRGFYWKSTGDLSDTIRFEGTNSCLWWSTNVECCPKATGAKLNLDFVVSTNGYAKAPVRMTLNSGTKMGGSGDATSGSAIVNVIAEEKGTSWSGREMSVPLISWAGTGGVNTNVVQKGKLPNAACSFTGFESAAPVSAIGANLVFSKGFMLIVY